MKKKISQTQGWINVIRGKKMPKKPMIRIFGTKESLGEDFPKELRCSNECDGGDVCVDTTTGVCSICGQEHIIETGDLKVNLDISAEDIILE